MSVNTHLLNLQVKAQRTAITMLAESFTQANEYNQTAFKAVHDALVALQAHCQQQEERIRALEALLILPPPSA